jgi:flagellar biosynthesis protein FliR
MDQLLTGLAPNAVLFMLIATRLSAMMVAAPVLSSRTIPMRVKAGLVVLISFVTLPLVAAEGGSVPTSGVAIAGLAVKEAVIGFAFGLVAQMLFAAVQTAGAYVDLGAGFAIAQSFDPASNTTVSVLGRYYNLVAITAFVAMGGVQLLVGGLVRSFFLAPPLAEVNLGAAVAGVLSRADDILLIAVQLSAPLLGALLIADITLGIISRAVPQMNVFIVGLPVKMAVALAGTAILLPAFIIFTNTLGAQMLSDLSSMMRAAGGR